MARTKTTMHSLPPELRLRILEETILTSELPSALAALLTADPHDVLGLLAVLRSRGGGSVLGKRLLDLVHDCWEQTPPMSSTDHYRFAQWAQFRKTYEAAITPSSSSSSSIIINNSALGGPGRKKLGETELFRRKMVRAARAADHGGAVSEMVQGYLAEFVDIKRREGLRPKEALEALEWWWKGGGGRSVREVTALKPPAAEVRVGA